MFSKIAFIGMGEAGGAIVSGWQGTYSGKISAFDIKTDCPDTKREMENRYKELGVIGADSHKQAVFDADIVFSTVTADQAVSAAKDVAPYISEGAYYCDLNSCAPSSKRKSAKIIEEHGGRYVDVAVMSPVFPKRNMVPLLLSGPHAKDIEPLLAALPMAPKVVSDQVGFGSSIKMIRSVFVKGLEALTSECMLAAVWAGVEKDVLASLAVSHPGIDWDARSAHNFERAMVHGVRRAAEMEEVVRTLNDLGVPAHMSGAAVCWQRRIAELKITAPDDPEGTGAREMALLLLPDLLSKSQNSEI